MLYNEVYSYHEADKSPVTDELNIFGLELEIDRPTEEIADILDLLIDDDYLTTPTNEHRTRNLKIIEDDSSVFKEIVFRADLKENLLRGVANLNRYGLTPHNVENSHDTSCHIHVNKRLLYELGITHMNFYKCVEFFNPFIYMISGRNRSSWSNWAEPLTSTPTTNINWSKQAQQVGNIDCFPSSRYHLVNPTNNTMEIRGFSNYNNFDYRTIEFYLSCVEFFIKEAEYMKGKLYIQHYGELVQHLKDFLESEFPQMIIKFNLYKLFEFVDVPRHYTDHMEMLTFIRNRLKHLKYYYDMDRSLRYIVKEYIDLLEDFNLTNDFKHLTLSKKGIKNQLEKISNKNQVGAFKNIYYYVENDLRRVYLI